MYNSTYLLFISSDYYVPRFSFVYFQTYASAAVSKAINDVFKSFSNISVLCLYYQQIQLALRSLRSQRSINPTSRFCDMFNFRIIP
jgi:hypothetical protein